MTNSTDTKVARARALIEEGKKPAEIAALLGTTKQYVYNLKALIKRAAKAPKRRGRPRKVKATEATQTAPANVTAQESNPELDALHQMVRVQLLEIKRLQAIIGYLEGRLEQHGAPV